jgi:addiction module RelE/StbE family toxin
MKVRYTRRALSDVASIAEYIHQHNPAAAQRVEAAIRSTVEMLTDFPKIGRECSELSARSLGVPRYPYTVYYRVRGKRVSILHIRHDSRKPVKRGDL